MKKQPFLFLILLLISATTYGQSISGKVIDSATKKPLQGATVYATNYPVGAMTDANGEYSFKVPIAGTFRVKASFMGYESLVQETSIIDIPRTVTERQGNDIVEKDIRVPAPSARYLAFELKPISIVQDEILITATQVSTARNNVPLTSSIINQTQLEQTAEINILPLLSTKVPGVFVTQRGISGFGISDGSAGKISIRGVGSSDQSQLLILINGQPQFMGIFGHGFPDMYNTSDLEKVEIIRGPASMLYGTNAMGGVINMITRKQKTDGFSMGLTGQCGSFNTIRGTLVSGYQSGKLSAWGSFNHDQTDGHRPSSEYRGDNAHIGLNYDLSKNFAIQWTGAVINFHSVDPGPIADSSSYANSSHWANVTRGNTMLSVRNTFEKADGHLNLFFNQGHHEIYTNWISTDKNYGISFFEGFHFFKNNLIGVGIDLNKYGGEGSTTQPYDNWADVSETGVYTFVQQTLFDRITLNGGIRYQVHSVYGAQYIPQIGATYKITNEDEVKLVASKGYRSPNIKELYFFATANPDLKPESLWNYEIGYTRYALQKRMKTTFTVFYIDGKNMIQTVANPTGTTPAATNQNTGSFTHWGGEFEGSYRISPHFSIDASYSYLNMDKPKIAAPKHQAETGVSAIFGKLDFAASIQWIGDLYSRTDVASTTDIDETVISNYVMTNARINYHVLRSVSVFMSGNNLLDQKYEINYGYPMPGISLMGGIRLTINE